MDEIKEIEARIRNVLIHFETAPAAEASAPIPASALPRPASPAQDTDPMARSLGQEPSLDGVEPHGQEPPAQEAPLDGVGSHGQEPPLDAVESHGQGLLPRRLLLTLWRHMGRNQQALTLGSQNRRVHGAWTVWRNMGRKNGSTCQTMRWSLRTQMSWSPRTQSRGALAIQLPLLPTGFSLNPMQVND